MDAYDVLDATAGRVGPRKLKAYWPEFQGEFDERVSPAEIGSAERRRPRRQPVTIADQQNGGQHSNLHYV
ncbi:hypothetical protein [Devosia sp. RR2S18]|uniref:hypothetical protein n=1 Tax=Devosia rhizosphaerae TaxID=3049774 RepID=UPI0025406C8A|nr:hypothetical protein [Devosia sp. RR2S18]WIJ23844.1 hypothetical protein QOV41_12340 [Devosia sp. RR2S18]